VPLAEKLLEVPQQLVRTALELKLQDGVAAPRGFKGSRVQGFKGSRVQGFKGYRITGFNGSKGRAGPS
jgi:hypothetical protein